MATAAAAAAVIPDLQMESTLAAPMRVLLQLFEVFVEETKQTESFQMAFFVVALAEKPHVVYFPRAFSSDEEAVS